jgi:hypothetical protein
MTLIYPNIVPENNLRLPDALTVKHGPAQLLSRFVLEGDMAARRIGLHLRLRHDFDELARLNRQEIARHSWYPLVNMFNPAHCDLTPENSYWMSGENGAGEIVVTTAWRVCHWPDSNLFREAHNVLYQKDDGPPCEFTPEAASVAAEISGLVLFGGAVWVHPDFRGRRLYKLLPRIGRAYGCARWPLDWAVGIVAPVLIQKGMAAGYGFKHYVHSILFHGAPSGHPENVLVYMSPEEAYEDMRTFLANELSARTEEEPEAAGSPSFFEHTVTKTSFEEVLQGSSSLS